MDSLNVVERCVYTHGEQAWRLAVTLMGNASDADDVVQQSLIIAWRKAGQIPPDDAWPWLAGIITREARNARRKRARRAHLPLTESVAMTETDLDRIDLHILIQRAMRRLPDDQREALLLTHIGGLTQAEAARALRVPLNTLKARVRRGMDALRERLKRDEGELGRCLTLMPVAMPAGGITVARATWVAGVQQYAAGAAAAAGVVKIKALAFGAAAVLGVAALVLWFIQDDMSLAPPDGQLAEIEDEYDRTPWPRDKQDKREKIASDQPERRPRGQNPEGVPGENVTGRPTRRPPAKGTDSDGDGAGRTPGAGDGENSRRDAPGEGTKEPARDNPAVATETTPVLWIKDWPPAADAEPRTKVLPSVANARFEQVWTDKETYSEVDRLQAVRDMPNGFPDVVPTIVAALQGDSLHCQAAAVEWVERESNHRALRELQEILFHKDTPHAMAKRLLHGMYRNPHWVSLKMWDYGLRTWLYAGKKGNTPLACSLIFEMGHVRGSLDNLETREENRERASLLLEAAAYIKLDVGDKVPHTDQLIRTMHLALASLCQAGYIDVRERDKVARSLRRSHATPNALMRIKRTYEFGASRWDTTAIDVETPRLVEIPLVILQDPDTTSNVWMPWMIELDLHFRCYLVDYRTWQADLEEAAQSGASKSVLCTAQVKKLCTQLVAMLADIGVDRFGLVAGGPYGPVADYLCRQQNSAVAFTALEAWPSFEMLDAYWRPLAENHREPKGAHAAEMLRIIHGQRQGASSSERLLAQEGQVYDWTREARQSTDSPIPIERFRILQFLRESDPHPMTLVAHYEFTGLSHPRDLLPQPMIRLARPYDTAMTGKHGDHSAWLRIYAQVGEYSLGWRGSSLWHDSATVFAEKLTELLEDKRVIPKRKK